MIFWIPSRAKSHFTILYIGSFPPYVFISKIDLCHSWFGQGVSCISYLRLFASQLARWRIHSLTQDGTTTTSEVEVEVEVEIKPGSSANKDPNSDSSFKAFIFQLGFIPPHYTYSIDRFEVDIDNSQPTYQHFTHEESTQVSTARMKSILEGFEKVYQRG